MHHCFSTLQDKIANGQTCVLVTVAHIAGSAPREAGARMIVTPSEVLGTVGGGNLEFEALRIARARLNEASVTGGQRFIELFPLGPMLQQCCGGAVFLHFEVVSDESGWLNAAAQAERDNTHVILASRTRGEPSSFLPPQSSFPSPRSSFLRMQESSDTTPAASGPYNGNNEDVSSGKMLFTKTGATGSLGNKQLEDLAKHQASTFLSNEKNNKINLLHSLIENESSLPDTSDALFFDLISPFGFHVSLFGAGHVGRALVNTLAGVSDCRITWVDSRPEQFPTVIPANVEIRLAANPVAEVTNLPEQTHCLVITHDHQLDQDLCEALLRRNDFAFLGLIGSETKRRRFLQRLQEKGISEQQMERLTCPIGIPGIAAKDPGIIAIAVAAQLLKTKSADDAD